MAMVWVYANGDQWDVQGGDSPQDVSKDRRLGQTGYFDRQRYIIKK